MDIQKLERYSKNSSWAIWNWDKNRDENKNNLHDTDIISDCVAELNAKYVLIGLNMSKDISEREIKWSNFHDNTPCRRLCYAFNISQVRGAYMTDLIQEKFSSDALEILNYFSNKENSKAIKKRASEFQSELKSIGVTAESTFILLGKDVQRYFTFFVNDEFQSNTRIPLTHYSAHGITDEEWVGKARIELNKFGIEI